MREIILPALGMEKMAFRSRDFLYAGLMIDAQAKSKRWNLTAAWATEYPS
jgi:hypothetical protein